jgi:hypothetical protein
MRMIGVSFGLLGPLCLAAMLGVMPAPASAKGCLKGAFVGGVAGHYAGHHGVLGAAAGCLIGRHEAKKQQDQTTGRRQQNQTTGRVNTNGQQ